MSTLAHAGEPELLMLVVPIVFIVVYRLARGPLPPQAPSEPRDTLDRT